ncbi:MAG: hypothetical protein HFJ55_01860 [Clostridia bacterium]|nr:hypothetical protein [Clostridia bacterium]
MYEFNYVKEKRGITLIALVVTIIVLLILAGTSIAMLTGENGIISQAQNAKNNSAKAEFEEKVKLAVTASRTNEEGRIDLVELETELRNAGMTNIEKNGPNEGLPWIVKENGYIYEIKEDGTVEAKSGVAISRSSLKLLVGGTYKLEVSKTDGVSGTATWKTNNAAVATVDQNGNVTAKGNVGDTTEITVEIGNHKDTCKVTIVSAVETISAEPIEVGVGETKSIVVKTTPSGVVEELEYSYSSADTSKVTVDAKTGEVTGVAITTTPVIVTITVTKQDGTTKTTTCQITVKKALKEVTVGEIKANKDDYYGQIVENYTADGATYRIFFVDEAGKYGEKDTVYLKADWKANDVTLSNVYTNYNKTTTKIKEMNPDWAKTANRGNIIDTSWNTNEKCAAYLCTPATVGNESNLSWSKNLDKTKANYVIGSPSVEMYCDSYNSVQHPGVTNYRLGVQYRATTVPGYIYTVNGGSPTATGGNDYYTGADTVDYKNYGSMYCGKNGAKGTYFWWLASPSSIDYNSVCHVYGSDADLSGRNSYSLTRGVSPLVSLRSDFTIQIEK